MEQTDTRTDGQTDRSQHRLLPLHLGWRKHYNFMWLFICTADCRQIKPAKW